MVKTKEESHIRPDGSIDLDAWLIHLVDEHDYHDTHVIHNASILSRIAGQEQSTDASDSCFQRGLAIAECLVDLELDQDSIAAGVIYNTFRFGQLDIDDIHEQLGPKVTKLVIGLERMSAIDHIQAFSAKTANFASLDNMRKMLLAMADDARVVLIKLADHLVNLRVVSNMPTATRQELAQTTMEIYAPLANRLGLGAIKWEMEDLAFRYLQPDEYKHIAKGLKARRVDRDRYVSNIVAALTAAVEQVGIEQHEIYGRSKHIHSIYRKMQRKNVDLEQIYDATAVRVLVPQIEDCYTVLGIVHDSWEPIPAEFDDYISQPKANGYQSLHTAVVGPEERVFEVQIRTFDMHNQAELGVAAHWKYKEGGKKLQSAHDRKIEWLRDVLSWHRDVARQEGIPDEVENELIEERVYVFTPSGDIIDLPSGSTPLDFAYHIHSQVGHRCRGAKVNGNIVALTYVLKTGEQVEILTSKQAKPSRDWMNPNSGYLRSSRARAKVLHWFKMQDFDKNLAEGKALFERECKKLGIKNVDVKAYAHDYNLKSADDLYAALGRGDVRLNQFINKISPRSDDKNTLPLPKVAKINIPQKGDVHVEGVGNLLTHFARCCHPVPGDEIIGYVTLGQGISIHRADCSNILHLGEDYHPRLLDVQWSVAAESAYPVDIAIEASDRHNLLHDITQLFSVEKLAALSFNTQLDRSKRRAYIRITLEIHNIDELSRILEKIKQINGVYEVHRVV